jgi:hypothetical protein
LRGVSGSQPISAAMAAKRMSTHAAVTTIGLVQADRPRGTDIRTPSDLTAFKVSKRNRNCYYSNSNPRLGAERRDDSYSVCLDKN